jgi:NAD(P)-dependent dehydrogenase (short-subunit alcohol dehydrogenase family)
MGLGLVASAAPTSDFGRMRVLITGAYGLLGAACLGKLRLEGHELVAAGRSITEAGRRFPYARWIKADFQELTTPESWHALLLGIDAVVNCVGALQEGARDDSCGSMSLHRRRCSRRVRRKASGASSTSRRSVPDQVVQPPSPAPKAKQRAIFRAAAHAERFRPQCVTN